MRIQSASRWLIPLALTLGSGCSSDNGGGGTPDGGGMGDSGPPPEGTGGIGTGGGAGGGAGGSTSSGGVNSKGGSGGEGKAGSTGAGGGKGGSGGAGGKGAGGSAGTGGASGAAGAGGALSFKCSDPTPNVEAPPSAWANVTSNLANMASECGNLGLVSANPCSDMVIVGVAGAGLWGTENGGKSWSKLGTGAGSATITNRISSLVYDPDHEGTFWESGIYGSGAGIYKTTDNGKTFTQVGDLIGNDSVSIDFTDPDRKTMLAGYHETPQKFFRSTDSGKTWNDIGMNVPASAGYCTATLVLSATNMLVGCTVGGVFHSSDGTTWTPVGSKGVTPQPLWSSEGSIYWPGQVGGIEVSHDQGQHFTETADANTAPQMYGPTIPAELPDGRIVILGKDHLLASSDKGATWMPIGQPLPYPGGGYDGARGTAYSARTKTFYIWKWDCNNNVPADAVMAAGFDYTKE